jgi:hypothetical protein
MGPPNDTGRPAASDLAAPTESARWSGRQFALLGAALLVGVAIRVVLLPIEGFRGDIDQFAAWVHAIATNGLGNAYDQGLAFGPVMALIWGVLAAVEPAFRTVTDASDPWIRALMRTPASLADIGLALLVAYALRARPGWAIVAAAAIVLHPAVLDVSIRYGQYESIYLLSALAAVVFALNGRNGLAAAALAFALMTKPQALPFLVPFAAWFWATGGPRGFVRCAAIGLGVAAVLWLPFVAEGGPLNYLHNLGTYQNDRFGVLSLRAWNPWWIVQEALGGGEFVADDNRVLGPLTFRHLGYALTALFELVVFVAVVRDPRPRTLILGLAASTMVAFCFLTTMHERYAYGVLVFLMLLIAERSVRIVAIAFAVVFMLNLWAAVPPSPAIGALLPVTGVLGIAGSVAMTAIALVCLRWVSAPRPLATVPRPVEPAPA